MDTEQFVSPALAEEICALSLEIHSPVTLLLDRLGRIVQIYVGAVEAMGEAHALSLPQRQSGLNQIRAVTTQLERLVPPGQGALTSLLQYRLDCMVTLIATVFAGMERGVWRTPCLHAMRCLSVAFNWTWRTVRKLTRMGRLTLYQLDRRSLEDFLAIADSDLAGWQFRSAKTRKQENAFLLGLTTSGSEARSRTEDLLDELSLLTQTAGGQVVGRAMQSRSHPDPQCYIGSGKAHELAFEMQQLDVDLVITDDELSSAQQRNLERILRVRVIDRTELILDDIFAMRAQSWEGKIQVELAQLQYQLPRLSGRGCEFLSANRSRTRRHHCHPRSRGKPSLNWTGAVCEIGLRIWSARQTPCVSIASNSARPA